MIQRIKNILNTKKLKDTFSQEYQKFKQTQVTSEHGYLTFRRLFVMTKGKLNDELSSKISQEVGKYPDLVANGILGNLNNQSLLVLVSRMKKDGFVEFGAKLPEPMVDAIYNYASKTPVSYMKTEASDSSDTKVIFDENRPISPRYDYTGTEIFQCPELQQLIFDPSLFAFAQEYLGCKPILDLVACWWSAPFAGKGKNAAAQMYHFDLDRIKFMKFFFYLTDVDPETGPHCFVKGSHGKLPKGINRDGRFEDHDMERIYGKENMMEICGKRGSIIAVDTRGFHKGKDLLKGKRLLFQIQFTNSLYGQTYEPVSPDLIRPEYAETAAKYSHTYSHIC